MARSGFHQHAAAYGGQPGDSSDANAYFPSADLDAAAAGANGHTTPHNHITANQHTIAGTHISDPHAYTYSHPYALEYADRNAARSISHGQRHAISIPVHQVE